MSRRLTVVALALAALGALLPRPAPAAELSPAQRRQVFDLVWRRVYERHFDPRFNGVDWRAMRTQYAPRAAAAKGDQAFYRVLETMLGELGQSHFAIIPPAAYMAEDEARGRPMDGEVGLVVQLVGGQCVVTRVEPGSPGEEAGIRAGYIVTHIDGQPLASVVDRVRQRELRIALARLQVMMAVRARLMGPSGSTVVLRCVAEGGRVEMVRLTRRLVQGERFQFGELPPMHVEMETRRLEGNVGYVRFNLFLMPLMERIRHAIREMSDARGIIIDLRGNGGGIGAMAWGVATPFFDRRASLGTMRLRRGNVHFAVFPQPEPFAGPLVVLTDEASLSTSEVLAGGLQELGRARIVGRTTGGMVLPSIVERLPGGARLQYAVADFRTPKGVLLEGRGVRPDVPVDVRRDDLLAGRDPVLEAGIRLITGVVAAR
ncbi:MAG TPA: S41 family peptidase [Chthonomonadales bacterium]|nr:S41 family peptidase [Chthonomonadales bacterium]